MLPVDIEEPDTDRSWPLVLGVAAWSMILLVRLLLQARTTGQVFAGSDSLFAEDQFQYLAWAREMGWHGLSGNLFDVPPGDRVFLHPMWVVAGLAARTGVPIAVAGLLWKPVVVVLLALAVHRYTRRLLPVGWERTSAAWLGLFYVTPATLVLDLMGRQGAVWRVGNLAGELFPAGQTWGYLPTVMAVALMPMYLLLVERLVAAGGRVGTPRANVRTLLAASGVGLLMSWVHPWQGLVMAAVTAGLVLWDRGSARVRPLLVALSALLLPPAGYATLAQLDDHWDRAQQFNRLAETDLVALVFALGPLALLALMGVRRPGEDVQERALLLWPVAALAVAVAPAVVSFPQHALEGMAIPCAVLAVRGFRGWSSGRLAPMLMVATLTVPGVTHVAISIIDAVDEPEQVHLLEPDEVDAFAFLAARQDERGVLASPRVTAALPGWTGHAVWAGHPSWTPDFRERRKWLGELSRGALADDEIKDLVANSGVGYVVMGCDAAVDLESVLAPTLDSTHRFGCATVHVLRRPAN